MTPLPLSSSEFGRIPSAGQSVLKALTGAGSATSIPPVEASIAATPTKEGVTADMQGYANRMNDEQIWNVVNCLRRVGP